MWERGLAEEIGEMYRRKPEPEEQVQLVRKFWGQGGWRTFKDSDI